MINFHLNALVKNCVCRLVLVSKQCRKCSSAIFIHLKLVVEPPLVFRSSVFQFFFSLYVYIIQNQLQFTFNLYHTSVKTFRVQSQIKPLTKITQQNLQNCHNQFCSCPWKLQTVFQRRNACSSEFLFIYFFRNCKFCLYQFLFNSDAGNRWVKWQYFVGSNKTELLENEHSSIKKTHLMRLRYSQTSSFFLNSLAKWFGTWTNRFSCFSSIKGPAVPLILPQEYKGVHKMLKQLNCPEVQEIIEGHYWVFQKNSVKNLVYIRDVHQVNCKREGPHPMHLFFPLGSTSFLSLPPVFLFCLLCLPQLWTIHAARPMQDLRADDTLCFLPLLYLGKAQWP